MLLGMRKHITKFVYLIVFSAVLFVPTFAYADIPGLVEALTYGPDVLLAYFFMAPITHFLKDIVGPILNTAFDWGTDWTTIPYVNKAILLMQLLAIPSVVAIRIVVGIRSGILRDGGSREYSIGEYIYKSVVSLVVVAAMPSICLLVIKFGKAIFDGVVLSTGGNPSKAFAFFDLSGVDPEALYEMDGQYFVAYLELLLLVLVIAILGVAVTYSFIRRQIEMLTVSLIAPWVAVLSATENDSSQVTDILKNLFGLVSQQWIQYVLVMVAVGFAKAWVSTAFGAFNVSGSPSMSALGGDRNAVQWFMFCIASFAAALTMPRLIDRYTFGASSSHVGGIMAMQGTRLLSMIARRK